MHGLIVNQIASDGATENVSAMKQLATLSPSKVFGNSFDDMLPNKLKVAFKHPGRPHVNIFIGGEMPHWMKKIVNAMESSRNGSSKMDFPWWKN